MISYVSTVVVAWMSSVGGSPMAATLSTPPRRGVSCARAVGGTAATSVSAIRAPKAWRLIRTSSRAEVARSTRVLEAPHRLRQELLRQPQHDLGEEHREGDGSEEHDVERQRASHRTPEVHADELRGNEQRQAVRRRDQAKHERGDDHDAHMHGVDVAE